MSEVLQRIRDHVTMLRLAFDRGFAGPLRLDAATADILLAIKVGTLPCALRVAEIAGLFADRKITRVPGSAAALIGLSGFRGTLVPVYSLQALLGLGSARPARWLVIAAADPVALAFESFEGQLKPAANGLLPAAAGAALGGCAKEFVRVDGFAGPVLHLPSVLEIVETKAVGRAQPAKQAEEER